MSAVFVDSFADEATRVRERLDNATENAVTGHQHFWLDEYHATILATLKDRVWRGAVLLERCRAALMRANHFLFLEGPQPQRIYALVDLFRSADPIREAITRRVVLGANAAFAYICSQDPNQRFLSPDFVSRLEEKDLERTAVAAGKLVDRLHAQLIDSNLLLKDENA